MEQERKHSIPWGTGRMAFISHSAFIEQQVQSGCPLTAVYERIKDSLAGMSYNAFTYHARKHFASTVMQRASESGAKERSIAPDVSRPRLESRALQKGSTNDKNTVAPRKPVTFRPGPRIPNPKDLY